jgi:hypothetical protein
MFSANVNERHTPVEQRLGCSKVSGCDTFNLPQAFIRSRDQIFGGSNGIGSGGHSGLAEALTHTFSILLLFELPTS